MLRLLLDPRMRQVYRKACSKGAKEVYRKRIMLVGHYGAGTRSVKRSHLNEKFVPDYQSTKGVEREETLNVAMTDVMENSEKSFRWKKVW